jgi:hypothetical protein
MRRIVYHAVCTTLLLSILTLDFKAAAHSRPSAFDAMKACPEVIGEGNWVFSDHQSRHHLGTPPRLQTLRDCQPAPEAPQILCLIENLLTKPFRSNKHEAQPGIETDVAKS